MDFWAKPAGGHRRDKSTCLANNRSRRREGAFYRRNPVAARIIERTTMDPRILLRARVRPSPSLSRLQPSKIAYPTELSNPFALPKTAIRAIREPSD